MALATAVVSSRQLGDEPSGEVDEGRVGLRESCLAVRCLKGCWGLGESGGGLVALIKGLEQFIEGALHRGYFIYYKV